MISMTLGLGMAAAFVTIFVNNRHSFNQDETILAMQDDARHAIRELTNDMAMAGLWADLVVPSSVTLDTSLDIGTDCGPAATPNWTYRAMVPGTGRAESLTIVDNVTVATANASYSCLGGEVLPGTDVIAIKRVAGARTAGALTADTVYLRTNGTIGLLFKEPADAPPAINVPAPFTSWEYRPSIYYIRNFAVTAGDGIPTLCRKVLDFSAPPSMVTECLAQGVENLQVEWGIDDDGDGNPNAYIADPDDDELRSVVSAKIFLLVRSADDDIRYTNEKVFSLSNAPDFQPNDNFYRRAFSIVVGLRNLKALRILDG
jgi:hypothetical protein